MNTREAFKHLCNDQERCERIGMKEGTRRSYLSYLKNNGPISLDKMEELLKLAGYHVKQEKIWGKDAGDSFFMVEEILPMIENIHPWFHLVTVKKEAGPVPDHHTYTITIKTKSPVS